MRRIRRQKAVLGRNSPIRFTEALGRITYEPRSFDMTFSMLGDRADFDRLVSPAVNPFSGQLCHVIVSDSPGLYAVGTIEADPSYDAKSGKGQLVLSCGDGDSISAGTWEIPELELRHGENTVSITSTGTTTFTYREGRL